MLRTPSLFWLIKKMVKLKVQGLSKAGGEKAKPNDQVEKKTKL